ncbi:hypothetical protein [Pelagicoccus sp. SDUM812005]|uniref:hypothetical protein n=1 Tax=Pelagicoccus sp. SDUM812005 TaxID=3041257 RepID=UPI00280D4B64|nr:hypothetical protein [Pelagicoccus sp. SDUM812005]MDQ8180356.1 hypothetical protein [Pelagicoccus sp. SDUM812005]
MPSNTKTSANKPSWSAVRKQLSQLEKTALLDLVKDLYQTSASNKDFLHVRCLASCGGEAAFESYRQKAIEPFYPKRGEAKLKLGEARKAIRQYRRATGDLPGTAELLMTYVENGVAFTNEYGDIDERFYSSIESALDELADLLREEGVPLYRKFSKRLATVERETDGIGWGFHDYVSDVVSQLASDFGNE